MSNDHQTIRIVLAEHETLFREVVRVVLDGEPDIEVVGEARDGYQAVAEAERTRPDLILMDAHLPNCDGIRATALVRQQLPDCQVLILSPHEDTELLVEALEAGAAGYLTKDSSMAELIGATRAVHRGYSLVPPGMLRALLSGLLHRKQQHHEGVRRLGALTARERQVLLLLADGGDNDAIAQALVISPQTARTHVQNILMALGVHSRLEAVAFVSRNELREELAPVATLAAAAVSNAPVPGPAGP